MKSVAQKQETMQADEFKDKVIPLSSRLLRFAGLFLDKREDAEDVVQDVLLKLWEKRDTLATVQNLEAFSMQMTRNRCLDKIKTSRTIPLNKDAEMRLTGLSRDHHDSAEWSDTARLVMILAGKLPEQQKTAIFLRDIEQKEFHEITEITGLNMNALRVNLSRARKQVKEELLKIWENESKRSKNIVAEIL